MQQIEKLRALGCLGVTLIKNILSHIVSPCTIDFTTKIEKLDINWVVLSILITKLEPVIKILSSHINCDLGNIDIQFVSSVISMYDTDGSLIVNVNYNDGINEGFWDIVEQPSEGHQRE